MKKVFKNSTKKSILIPIGFVALMMTIIGLYGNEIEKIDPVIQYILIGLPIAVVIFWYFESLQDTWKHKWNDIVGLIFVALAWDLVQPPYAVNFMGQIISNALFSGTAVDYFMGYVLQNIFSGTTLFYAVYLGGFVILYVIGLKISGKKIIIF